ncbi:MAG: hypothetical protein OHK93_000850 [Ramalina farinacea]|uniref:Major facilitator superfamily (MFS) profile domain-containing protein n=1 Tax=Ramalina farinacea TaxID=258253 RepID=A0AA43QRN9_9LECA|nr:hypothetical protein [Ramalina farinacea]
MSQFRDSIGELSSIHQGIYVACFLLSAALSALASGNVSDRISRKFGIMTGAGLTMLGTIISAASPNFVSLIIARLITGLGAGQTIAVTTIYLVEVAPLETRGTSASLLQMYISSGIALGYFIAFGSSNADSEFYARWLVQAGRSEDARQVLAKVRPEQRVQTELNEIEDSLAHDLRGSNAGFGEIFGRRYIKRTTIGILLMMLQQTTGALYFAPLLFRQAGLDNSRASFLASGVTGLVIVAFTIPPQIWMDRWSRKRPLILGGSAVTVCLLVIGALYQRFGYIENGDVKLNSTAAQWAVIVLIYLFAANFSWSWGVIMKIYACEIIPTRLRAKTCAVEQLANWVVNFVIAFTAPMFLRASPSGPYFFYGFCTLGAVILCVFIPDTKGKSLEEIEGLFEKREPEVTVEELTSRHGGSVEYMRDVGDNVRP